MKKSVGYLSVVVLSLIPATINFAGSTVAAAPGVTPNSVTIAWTSPGDDGSIGTAMEYDIRYSTSPITAGNWAAVVQVAGEPVPQEAGNTEEFTVTGLESNTTYYFAIMTADEVPNWSGLSNVISRTTALEETPPSAIANLLTGNVTTGSIALSWTAPGDDGASGTASLYDIRYSTSNITDLNWDAAAQVSGEPIPQSAGSSESMTVTGLNENTTYYFAIKTADEVPNWSGLSNIASGTTSEGQTVPPAPVLATPANGATDLAQPLAFDWSDIADIDSYQIQIDDNATMTSPVRDITPVVSTYTVSGLDDGGTYYWRVRAHNAVGWGNWTEIRSFTLECTIPAVPVLALPADGTDGLTVPILLDWSDVTGAAEYHVQVDDASNFGSPNINVNVSASQYSASGLDYDATYYWRVRTVNGCGYSNFTTAGTFSTADTATPTPIATLNAIPGTEDGEVALGWIATGDDGAVGTATSYDIRYSLSLIAEGNWAAAAAVSGEPAPQTAGTPEGFIVTGLSPSTTYYFAIKVSDEAGNTSAISNVANSAATDKTPPAPIMDLSVETGGDDGEIYMEWTATGDDGNNGIATAYLIKYSTRMITVNNWEQATIYEDFVVPLPSGQLQSLDMTGYEPGETYYLGIQALDEAANASELSNIASCEAGVSIVLAVDDENTEPASPGSGALLHSSRPTLAVRNITAQGDNVYHFEVAADSFFIDLVALSSAIDEEVGDKTTWKIDQPLEAGIVYYWRAKANDFSYCATSNFSVMPQTHAYPNPFRHSEFSEITFTDVPEGANLIIMTVSGTTVRYWDNITGGNVTWDGSDESGVKAASGTYLWFIEGTGAQGKLIVMQ